MTSFSFGREPEEQQKLNDHPQPEPSEAELAEARHLSALGSICANAVELRHAAGDDEYLFSPACLRNEIDGAKIAIGAMVDVLLESGVMDKAAFHSALAAKAEAARDEHLAVLGLLIR